MMRITTLIAASLFATAAFGAEAETEAKVVASLTTQQGTVLVNQGEEFITASEAHALKAGDRVMVMEGGAAEVAFTDGCVLPLASGSLVQVPAISTCAGDVAKVEYIGPTYAQAVGATDDEDPSTAKVTFWVGTAIVAIVAAAGGDESQKPPVPVSP